LNHCSICNSKDLKVSYFEYQKTKFKRYDCVSCSFTESEKLGDKESDQVKYSSKQYKIKNIYRIPILLNFIDFINYRLILKKFGLNKDSYILDFGCGKGIFIKFLSYFGFNNLHGYEIEKNRSKFAKNLNKNANIYLNSSELKQNKFDFISLIHVLEHIKDPEKIIKEIKQKLNKDGILLIEVPNFYSASSRFAKNYWAHFTPQYHTNHFSINSLKKLLKNNGFKIKTCSTLNLYHGYNSVFSSFLKLIGFKSSNFYQTLKFRFYLLGPAYVLLFPFIYLFEVFFSFKSDGSVIRIISKT